MKQLCTICFLCVLVTCRSVDVFEKIRNDTYDDIHQGTYHGSAVYIRDTGDFESFITDTRSRIEDNSDVLPLVTKKFFSTPESLAFRYKFTAHDVQKGLLILRYFARRPEHPLYAGYQIQFVFEAGTKKLVDVYTAEVPLE